MSLKTTLIDFKQPLHLTCLLSIPVTPRKGLKLPLQRKESLKTKKDLCQMLHLVEILVRTLLKKNFKLGNSTGDHHHPVMAQTAPMTKMWIPLFLKERKLSSPYYMVERCQGNPVLIKPGITSLRTFSFTGGSSPGLASLKSCLILAKPYFSSPCFT